MKRLLVQLVLALACMGLSAAYAEQHGMTKEQKDECLLVSKQCQNATLSIQEKMEKLQQEINKGTTVYTPEELKMLQKKLKDAEDTLDNLLKH